ncbi:MAG TPA: ABC transporter permease [Steroidobacteraceae bacterium]|nr:ABC transporter permease [Steroidobacteraceae bacterium]
MNFARQFFGLLRVNLSGAARRTGPVLTIVVGVTCAVGVLVSMLAMGVGAQREEMGDVRADRVVLITSGARSGQSSISRDEAVAILGLPGIRKSAAGEPTVVFESLVFIEGRRRVTSNRIYFPLVGVTATLTEYRPEIRFTGGRMFERGLHELIASNPCARQFTGFDLGDRRAIHGADWVIVGQFNQGLAQQCVVYADVDGIMSAFGRNTYSAATVRLRSAADFAAFRDAVTANPTLHLEVKHESEAVEDGFKQLNAVFNFVSYFVGTIMAIAATLGAVNSLYAIVDSRRRELATLRAIGFGPGIIIASILCESVLLAVPGALLGGALAWIFFNGLSASPFGYSFQLAVTPSLAALGMLWALGMGLVGGLLPALRAARVPVTTALRAT